MTSFGARIRRERQRRGITLTDVSQETKISLQYLNALERNDFQKLPGGVFNRGYVRSYARFIGADPETMVQAYVAEQEARGVEDKTEDLEQLRSSLAAAVRRRAQQGNSSRNPGRIRILAVGTPLLIVVLALAGWYYLEHRPWEGDRAYGTVAAWSGVLPASWTSSVAEPPVLEPQPEPVEPPPGAVAIADTARTGRTASADVVDTGVRTASLDVAPSSPDETDFLVHEQQTPIVADDPVPLSVSHFGVGTGVVNHELQGRSDRFEEGGVVWFWTRVLGGHAGEFIRHVWYRENNQVGEAILTLGGPHWRTQSRRPLEPGSAGRWSVEVRDAEDRLLVREQFVCVPAENTAASPAQAAPSY